MPDSAVPGPEWEEIAFAQAAESLLKVSWGLKAGPALAWDASPPHICPHSCHCATAQGPENLPTLCGVKICSIPPYKKATEFFEVNYLSDS
jgi:hypothetical protein